MTDLTDDKLAAEDWKCLFLLTLAILALTLGFLISAELNKPIEYCSADFCIRENEIIK